jgi:hypothetical protein
MPTYRVTVRGPLPEGLLDQLRDRWGAVDLGPANGELRCTLVDEAALRGLLTALWDAGLALAALEDDQG